MQHKSYTQEQKLKIALESPHRDATIQAVRIKNGEATSALRRCAYRLSSRNNPSMRDEFTTIKHGIADSAQTFNNIITADEG